MKYKGGEYVLFGYVMKTKELCAEPGRPNIKWINITAWMEMNLERLLQATYYIIEWRTVHNVAKPQSEDS